MTNRVEAAQAAPMVSGRAVPAGGSPQPSRYLLPTMDHELRRHLKQMNDTLTWPSTLLPGFQEIDSAANCVL